MKKRFLFGALALIVTLVIALSACGGNAACNHEYENACDTVCSLCGESRAATHTYDNECDVECTVCGATREGEGHSYDNGCDTDCNTCGATREVEGHAYDNGCDTDCNTCGATREVEGHAYDNGCDTDCNTCGATREFLGHTDSGYDGICDSCGEELEVEIPALTAPSFDPTGIPEYDNTVSYVSLNGNIPYFTENQLTVHAYEHYSSLDALERCGAAVACLGTELLPEGSRGSLSHNPTAWHGKAIYERCHLIAWSLAGENNNAQNLITGTYDLNGVMQTFESMVLDHIKETGNHVMYRATPVFEGDNLLASGVILEGWSVEDGGEGICFNIYIYNAQDNCIIDYASGDYEDPTQATYIVNKNNGKIHKATCQSAYDMKEENKIFYYGTLEEVIADLEAQGKSYTYCGGCKPQNG